jgi:His-Xaa-Ser system protein HxsD
MIGAPSWVQRTADGTSITVGLDVYTLDAVLRACHAFTARCYVFVRMGEGQTAIVDFAARDEGAALMNIAGDFSNALLDYQLRAAIAAETQSIREILVAQAFCEASFLDDQDRESDEYTDPRGIAR